MSLSLDFQKLEVCLFPPAHHCLRMIKNVLDLSPLPRIANLPPVSKGIDDGIKTIYHKDLL
jgi:hypothetical protein